MKNKSTRHKEFNTFKFQPFAERIANIDVDIFHKVGHEYETQTVEHECYFHQAIQNWSILNLTEGFDNFKKEIRAYNLVTLPQLILDKDHVVQVLLKHLKLKNPLSLQPLLDIVVAVANDLRKDFYEHYNEFLEVLIDILNTKDTDVLEWTFTCLAYLFKFLWRPLLKDITSVFNTLLPLLSRNKPDYINSFAAESFAFVARKVKDSTTFLIHILNTVRSRKDGVEGCGKLFFEIIHGVNGQFHSCAETILPFLINSLSNPKCPQKTLFEILEQVISNIVGHIQPQKSALLWETLIACLNTLENNWKNLQDVKTANEVELILKLLGQTIEYHNGKFLQNPLLVIQGLIQILSHDNLPESVMLTIIQVAVLLLLSTNIKLTQEQAAMITRKVLSLSQESVLLYFIDNVSSFSSFEAFILPTFLKRCVQTDLHNDSFKVLTKLILTKAPLSQGGINLPNWVKYSLDFGNKDDNSKVENIFLTHLDGDDVKSFLASLICLPHLSVFNKKEDIITKLTNKLEETLLKIKTDTEVETSTLNKNLFILNNIVECLIHLNSVETLSTYFTNIIDTILNLTCNESHIFALRIVDLLITVLHYNETVINMDILLKFNDIMSINFSSPFHEVRLLTTHMYTFFENLPEFDLKHSSDPEVAKEKFIVFSTCYRVESIEPSVQTYRDQLQNLEKLNFDKPQMLMCNQTHFNTVPLRYLCGALYMNFKLLWEPVSKIIETHAHGLAIGEFWKVFGEELRNAVKNLRQIRERKIDALPLEWDFLQDLYENSQKSHDKPDFFNYHLLLWKAMGAFADVAEAKTRDVSELFLDFIEKEYTRNNSAVALKWNIKQNFIQQKPPDNVDEGYEEDASSEKTDPEKEDTEVKETVRGKKGHLQVLLASLVVFSKVRSPMSIYREPELNKLYLDLLQHKNPDIQKAALDCITTYKHKYLTPYKQHLYNLIDDKQFKNELTTFQIDKESSVIQADHRESLIPLIMKITFSKMSAKTGLRTGGKASGQLRRNLILRFLAGCQEQEMLTFVQMAFRYYNKYLDDDSELMVDTLTKSIDLENFIPPKRLQSTLNLLNVILEQFGGLMGNQLLTYILQIVLLIGSAVKGALKQISNVHAGYLAILRNLRNAAIKTIERFFGQFDRYPWTNKQINAIFKVFVWPYLPKLNTEGIHSPTTLLKLFMQWASNPRYFPLLVKHMENDESEFVLPHVIGLLTNEKSHVTVINVIEEMIERLLSLQANEEDLQLVIPVDNLLPVAKNILERLNVDEKLNYGSCILLPSIPSILTKIKKKLEGKNKSLNQRELFILSRISELVWESEISDSTLKLLLPVVLKRCSAPEEVTTQFLSTIQNLLNNVDNPEIHLRQIIPMFGEVSHAPGRKILTQILRIISIKCESLGPAVDLIDGMNAFDAKWIDQPDFQKRHDTFKELQKSIEDRNIELELGVLVIYNCFYFLKSEKDLSLKDNSSHCLKQIAPYLINKYKGSNKDMDYILNETILTLIRNCMKSKNHDFRNESVSLLGHLARECPESHVVLRDLHKYTNKTDLEVDFFENITHLQLHRHARALLKFCQITKELTSSPNIRSLTQFILPLASFYLCNEKYVSKNSVVDAAIECVSVICRILPWHQYEGLLKFYLDKLRKSSDYQKQLVRITVVILDSFHYDLHKAQLSTIETKIDDIQENVKEITPEAGSINKTEQPEDFEEIDIGEALDVIEETPIDEEEQEEEDIIADVKICDKTTILCKSTATRVIRTIQLVMLPQLHKSLAELTQYDRSHKVNRKKTGSEREEEDLLRVPISLALVKLLQRLPKEILENNLPGIFMKLCTFLKSQLESVRRVTRETLQKIMQTLGPEYLHLLFSEMTPLLSRGYQVHVLVFTTHAVLNCLKDDYKSGDIDKILLTILNLCQADLFGSLSEEREVAKIAVKTSEAKTTKSFDTWQILAQFISDKCFMDLILPIKNVLQTSHSFKTVHKAQECLRHISLGLVDNNFVETESLLKFAYGTASESIPELISANKKPVLNEKEREKLKRARPDCFIIPKAPVGRSGVRLSNVKSSLKTNAHLIVEFGLRLCFVMLKRDKLKDGDYKPFLDPFVIIFKNCLTSKHVKLSTLTLQCLIWVMKFELPSMKEHIVDITQDIFSILHKSAGAGLSKGDNFDLVGAAFKLIAVLIRDVKYYTVNTDQLKILLLYAEQDIHDHDRQATAFNLLKAIIARKLIVPEIHEVMKKVAELSITSELNYVRSQSRVVFHQYLMDYPLGDNLEKHLSFYLSQMSYELQFGRESAIEMVATLISSFPTKVLVEHSGTLFITLGARLVNDEVPECRKLVANSITQMLNRLERNQREPLFDIVVLWLKDKKVSHRRLAAQLCGLFVNVEKTSFETRLPKLLPVILKQFGPQESEQNAEDDDEEFERVKDHHLFQVLQLLLKLCSQCPSFLKKREIEDLANHIQALLGHPHEWVRLSAAQFLGYVLGSIDIEYLSDLVTKNESRSSGYLFRDSGNSVKRLSLDLCDQLQPGSIKKELAEQVIKNLVFIARVLKKIPVKEGDYKTNLLWLTKRMRKIVNTEVVETPTDTVLRTEVFKWIAGVATVLDLDSLNPILVHLLAPLVREMITTEESNAPLRQLSKEVAGILKKKMGIELYTSTLASLQQSLSVKRSERKRARNQLAVTDPEAFAKKKIKKHEKKKDAKKRKIAERKGTNKKNFKRRKVLDLEPESEVM